MNGAVDPNVPLIVTKKILGMPTLCPKNKWADIEVPWRVLVTATPRINERPG